MEPIVVISILGGCILLLLFLGAPVKPVRFIGQGVIKLLIGALFLFFLNAFGNQFGIHVPINLATASISGFLGIPGLFSLVAIQTWII
ncbi:pro-sigmaK processing inhibitor BofA family protein [Bacillus sp. FJAT-49705]|uniref:Pro-sigmaK processing inhibitor BofA n=2 Tax=Cytobacillus TaxID=2675230 RepID=A0A5B8YYV2_CYTDA|nr:MULTISPECIES: pro-sigmaK processing inhibitor BofA family protein [Cytobacillus]MBS4193451.1 pro-sigmaK processing inhibitor BofA family protein [Cytobacillus citreus]QED45860.1 pro-sigmaK processing inhibitor BofA [Cytobacillus dafuensis]